MRFFLLGNGHIEESVLLTWDHRNCLKSTSKACESELIDVH